MRQHRGIVRGLALLLALGLTLLGARVVYAADRIHVKPTASGTGDGSSWQNATTLAEALGFLAGEGDEIWVATGVYTPGFPTSTSFNLRRGVAVYGGFAGTEVLLFERDWRAHPSILSGDLENDDLPPFLPGSVDQRIQGFNSNTVVKASGGVFTETTILDGFTIMGGYAAQNGGGFYCDGNSSTNICQPTLRNLIFTQNYATDDGGALYNDAFQSGEASPFLINVEFIDNLAGEDGGAIANNATQNGKASPTLANVLMYDNHAVGNGGAIYNLGITGDSSPTLVNATIVSNTAESLGGGMYSDGLIGISDASMTNTILWGNRAGSTSNGHQVYNSNATLSVRTSLVEGGVGGAGIFNLNSEVSNLGGNLAGDPRFLDAAAGNFRLESDSPAVDTGTNIAVIGATDLDGYARVADGNFDQTAVVDMGAYELTWWRVEVDKTGNGEGWLRMLPENEIVCPLSCDSVTLYSRPQTTITLTMEATFGSSFEGWDGACDGVGACVVLLNRSRRDLYADLSANEYALTINTVGDGNVTRTPDQNTYILRDQVIVTATAEVGYTFAGWEDTCSEAGACDDDILFDPSPFPNCRGYFNAPVITATTCVVNINGPRTVTATFTQNSYPLTVTVVGGGSVSRSKDLEFYFHGSVVTLTATAAPGYTFAGWDDACNGKTNKASSCELLLSQPERLSPFALAQEPLEYVVTMVEPRTITATFTQNSYPLTVTVVGGGSVEKSPDLESYPHGTEVTLTPNPGAGSVFGAWGGACTGAEACVITMTGPKSVTATFNIVAYGLSVPVIGGGSVSKSPDLEFYPFGTLVTLTPTPDSGYSFSEWGGACSGSGDCIVTILGFTTVTATFTENPDGNTGPTFTSTAVVSATVGANYIYTVTANDIDAGDLLTISASLKPDWLTLTQTGNGSATLTGAPAAENVGLGPVRLRVEDQDGAFATQLFTITVNAAPANTGSVQGTVVDDDDNGIAGAEVSLQLLDSTVQAASIPSQTTDANGAYRFDGVPIGNYALSVVRAGYEPRDGIAVSVDSSAPTSVPTIVLQAAAPRLHLPTLVR